MFGDIGYTFDDILLVPQYAYVEREDTNTSSELFGYKLDVPILSSPMDTITGELMMRRLLEVGAVGVHHRYCDPRLLVDVARFGLIAVAPRLGLDFIKYALDENDGSLNVVLDVAHGCTKKNLDFCNEMVKLGINVISGNIATVKEAEMFLDVGVKYLRVGIGSGSVCTTRMVAGVGVPQAKAIRDIYDADLPVKIISDGGHRTTGDIAKALALGADYVMLGGMLAGTNEALGTSSIMAIYRGMASEDARKMYGNFDSIPEGVSKAVSCKGPIENIIKEIKDALQLAMYYVGVENLMELRWNAKFVMITQNGYREGAK